MSKCQTKVTNKGKTKVNLKKQSQLTAEAATVTRPNVNLREKRPRRKYHQKIVASVRSRK